jgi:thioredoxin 2
MEQARSEIIPCPGCGAKNRIPEDKLGKVAKCGKCGAPFKTDHVKTGGDETYRIRCVECGAKNRILSSRLNDGAICGKCHNPLKTDALFTPQPIMVTDANFEAEVLKSPLPAIVFAWAPWCPTCRTFLPIIDEYGREAKGKVRVGKVNVDQNPMISSKYNIFSVPQLFIFDNGQLKESLPGALPKHELMMKMAPYL